MVKWLRMIHFPTFMANAISSETIPISIYYYESEYQERRGKCGRSICSPYLYKRYTLILINALFFPLKIPKLGCGKVGCYICACRYCNTDDIMPWTACKECQLNSYIHTFTSHPVTKVIFTLSLQELYATNMQINTCYD